MPFNLTVSKTIGYWRTVELWYAVPLRVTWLITMVILSSRLLDTLHVGGLTKNQAEESDQE